MFIDIYMYIYIYTRIWMHRYVRTCFTDLFEKTPMSRNRPMHLECLSFKPPLCHLLLRCKSSGNPRPPNELSIPVRKARAQLFNRKGDMSTTIPLAPVEKLHTAIFATWTNPSTAESSCKSNSAQGLKLIQRLDCEGICPDGIWKAKP